MNKEKCLKVMSIILLIIYAIIFVFMIINQFMMGTTSGISADVLAVSKAAIHYGLIHSVCNIAFNILALCSLKYRKIMLPTVVIGVVISIAMRYVSYIFLGSVSYITLSLVLRIFMMILLVMLFRETGAGKDIVDRV